MPLAIFMSLWPWLAVANPTGGTVVQGSATINSSGSQLNINQTSGSAFINWQSFNINSGETTVFNQPSSSSVTWNYISDPNASILNGNLSANGYVVLQNPNGFTVGGSATLTAHGLVMTTASTPKLDLSSGGTWSFNAPPPKAKIVNYGRINITGGGSAYLIASDILNNGAISAPGGQIGLYAGEKVLVSMAPDGRGLSAQVTLPQGSVDNEGKLIADSGSIAAQAKFVNQNGLVQANSVKEVNGTIELVASDAVNLGAHSSISAKGDSKGVSDGGTVAIKSNREFSDVAGSTINIAGGTQGGNGGQTEISAKQMGPIQTEIQGAANPGYLGGALTIDPVDLMLDSAYVNSLNAQISGGLSQINLQADNNIELITVWTLADVSSVASVSLTAGNNIILDTGSAIAAGNNWSLNLAAGTQLPSGAAPASGQDGLYLNGSSYLQTQNGDITVNAANEVIVNSGAIRTVGGGNIDVTAAYGDVNTGSNPNGYLFGQNTFNRAGWPYYYVDSASLGGISTAAGGNVAITAGKDVISGLPTQTDWTSGAYLTDPQYFNPQYDGGSGAFGFDSGQAGNVTVTAGGNVYGHYVVGNGVGSITAGGNVGVSYSDSNTHHGFALSLISGSWEVNAPKGNIYVQDINNPNGVFGEGIGRASTSHYNGYHLFDYSQKASVSLSALDTVEITGKDAPQAAPSVAASDAVSMPIILPPSFSVNTVQGNFIMDTTAILFPSADQNLSLNIGGNFVGTPNGHVFNPAADNPVNLEMSDSAATRWTGAGGFGTSDHASSPPELNSLNPAVVSVSGNMKDVNLYLDKRSQITVGGNLQDCGIIGQNLHSTDVTGVHVGGSILNSGLYSFTGLSDAIVSANPLQPNVWDSLFWLAVDPGKVASVTSFDANNKNVVGPNGLAYYLKTHNYLLFPTGTGQTASFGVNPGFVYDPNSLELGFKGSVSSQLTTAQIQALESGTITVLNGDAQGNPYIDPTTGHLSVTTYHFDWGSAVANLVASSVANTTRTGLGIQIGGPGTLNVAADSIDLGNSDGIVSYGFGSGYGADFATLQSVCGPVGSGGANVNVTARSGNIDMVTSRICSIDGGKITVKADAGEINLSQGAFVFPVPDCYGIWTSGHSGVEVEANGDINVGSARIATFNGGNVAVTSDNGNINCGNGNNIALLVYAIFLDPVSGLPVAGTMGDLANAESLRKDPAPYGSGILAEYPTAKYQLLGGNQQPGNITVDAPNGNIVSGVGGIAQFALNQSLSGDASVTLNAGRSDVSYSINKDGESGLYENGVFKSQGNVLLGLGGVIGGTINVTAQGLIQGLVVSQHDANINAGQSFSGTVIAGGAATFGGSGSISGTIVGIGGINTGNANVGSGTSLLSQNVSGANGQSMSTLGTSANATAAAQAAAQQSSQEAARQVASTSNGDDEKKKKKKKKPELHKVSRVTVFLSASVPPQ